ncbi:MAG: rod shape-determining protein RodA [Magnetococcales bacterium]|nr:rod shape-determining protein RodA [Magnetococcales bacterium]
MSPTLTHPDPDDIPPIRPAGHNTPVGGVLSIDGTTTLGWQERWQRFPWSLLALLMITSLLGLVVLYSAVGGRGDFQETSNLQYLLRQAGRFGIGLVLLFVVAFAGSERVYRRYAYLAYGVALALLVAVFLFGSVSMGARRWLDVGFMRIQPSELMKVTLVLALARYYHDRAVVVGFGWRDLGIPLLLVTLPLLLILKQPDLGTAIIIATVGMVVIVVAGLSWKMIVLSLGLLSAGLPIAWSALHEYQRQRVYTLFSPERDPLGSGYHIIQSKIAVGSGGLLGKGFMAGSQSHLDFLPERHTDFIFSVLAEEWGFVGCVTLIVLYILITSRGLFIASMAHHRFGLLTVVGFIALFAFQVIINIGMVIGLLPVVGIPLPLISYGGSSMITLLFSMGLIAHVGIYSRHHGRTI